MRLQPARIHWDHASPRSREFNDVYFSAEGGLAESRHVFLRGNQLAERWQAGRRFVIAETGFGTGLNFLATWQLWRQCMATGELFYISAERYPLLRSDLARALAVWTELKPLSDALLQHWPAAEAGMHPLRFDGGKIRLLLLFGDALPVFRQLRARVDAWYLDGFAPARNPELWSEELFHEIARLSAPQATFATFTAAGIVRRGLQQAGFVVEKIPGFGRKREMLHGRLARLLRPAQAKPWFPLPATRIARQAVVIGAGLAGSAMAYALQQRGIEVTLIERHAKPAQEASGNPRGVLMPLIEARHSTRQRWYAAGYRYSLSQLRQLSAVQWSECGVLVAGWNQRERQRHAGVCEHLGLPAEILRPVGAAEAGAICGLDVSWDALYLPHGAWVDPRSLCRALLTDIRTLYHQQALQLALIDKTWRVLSAEGKTLAATDIVVLAGGRDAGCFQQTKALPLSLSRGQLTQLPATAESALLQTVVCGPAYLLPSRNGWHELGASYSSELDIGLRAADQARNLSALAQFWPALAKQWSAPAPLGRAAIRTVGPDHLPLVGPVPDRAGFYRTYSDLGRGFPPAKYPPAPCPPGLYISAGHGSRGLSSTLLAAELLAAMIADEPLPVEAELAYALHPARFWLRDLRRSVQA